MSSSVTPDPTSERGRRLRTLTREPSGAIPFAAKRRAWESSGIESTQNSAVVPDASIISCAWPSRP